MKETLQRIRDLIQGGWCQGRYSDGYGCYCLTGAILAVVNGDARMYRAIYTKISNILDLDPVKLQLPVWNDDPTRTKEDVLAVLDEAIAE